MVKLTVLYNLPPGTDHEEFLKWRTGPHQERNVQMPGLLKTDFYAVFGGHDDPPRCRYITELYFPDRDTFEDAFYDEGFQKNLDKSLERVVDTVFLFSEEVLTTDLNGD